MSLLLILRHPIVLVTVLLRLPGWYFGTVPKRIVRGYWEYARAFSEIFSVWFLVKTLLKPWKSITDKYPDRGLNIALFAQAFTLNCTSRVIGMLFRLTALVFEIVSQVALLVGFIVFLLFWLTFPLLLLLDIFYLIGVYS